MDFALNATTVIKASPDEVFDRITDIDRLPDWNLEIRKVIERPDVLAVGAEWIVQIHAMKTRWNSRSTVTAFDPAQRRFTYRSQSDDGNPSYADWCWDVVEDDDGTRVRVSVSGHPRTFARKWFISRVRPRGLHKAMQQSLGSLREQVSAR